MRKASSFVLACLGILIGTAGLKADEARLDLTGQIIEPNGAPIGKASVFIYTAKPRQGTSSLCPSCYPDCQKQAETDKAGRFKIEGLDPALLFRLLVVAAGHESKLVPGVDPQKGESKIKLKLLSEAALKSSLRIKGEVIDEHGNTLPGAIISPEGIEMGEMTRWGGNDSMVEPLAVADEAGQFVLFCKSNTVDSVYATVEGRGVAKQWVTLKPGGDYLVQLPEGVTLKGQVLRDGQPMQGVSIAANTKDRKCGVYFNVDAVSTDSNGRFLLPNVPPNLEFVVFSTMKSLAGKGALPEKILTTGDSGTVMDLGSMSVQPAYTVAGRIVLSDGKPVPLNTRLDLSREEVSDSVEATTDANGRFEFKDVPASSVSLDLSLKGYRLSKRNPSLDWLNGQILGRVNADVTDLTILLDPGKWQSNDREDSPGEEDEYPDNKPLRGLKL